MSSLPRHIIECPHCQTALDLSALATPAAVRCPECDREVCHVGPFPVPVERLPPGNDAIDWMLDNEPESVDADELPARVCPWCGRNVGGRPSCPECGCDVSKTGRLLLRESAAGLAPESCGLLELQAVGPFATEARLARLLRLPPGRAIEMGLHRGAMPYLPAAIPEVPGLAPEFGGTAGHATAGTVPEDTSGHATQAFCSSLGRRVVGRSIMLLCWLLLTLIVGAVAGFGVVLASGSSNPAMNLTGMVGSILAFGMIFWQKMSPSMLGRLTFSNRALVAQGILLKRRWRPAAVSSIELLEEPKAEGLGSSILQLLVTGRSRLRVKLTSGKEPWTFGFGDKTADCAKALRQVCGNAAFVGLDGETHLPTMPDDPALARENLGNTHLRRGRAALLLGCSLIVWFGPLAVIAALKALRTGGEDAMAPVCFGVAAAAGLCPVAIGVGLIRKGRRILK